MTPREMIKKLRSGRIDEIDICGYEIANTIESLLTGPPQIKELSDEEIRVFMAEMPHLTERKDLLMFAKAILKKASEK